MKKNRQETIDILNSFLEEFWFVPSDALLRTADAALWSKEKFTPPVLDIGCGDGRYSKLLFKDKGEIDVGLDVDPEGVKKAKNCGLYKRVVVANASKMPFRDGQFKTIVSNSTFEHIKDDIKAVSESSRVLAPGGRLFFTAPTPRFIKILRELGVAEEEVKRYNKRVLHLHYRSLQDWKKVLAENSLEVSYHKYYFPKEIFRVWYPLFKLATTRVYHRELWSYLKDSPYKRLVPSGLIKSFLKRFLKKYVDEIFRSGGAWLYIVAEKK
jgi:SAM-dependent methyltransferase